LYLIVVSPTAMSYFCQSVKENCLTKSGVGWVVCSLKGTLERMNCVDDRVKL
jgi:hypothetical protein